MSLIIAVSDGTNLCVAADTLDSRSGGAPLPAPVEKVRIFDCSASYIVAAISGGDIVVNDKHLFTHIDLWKDRLSTVEGFQHFADYFREQWTSHFEAYEFSSDIERKDYLAKVKTSVFVARNPSDVSWFDGTCGNLKIDHDPQWNGSLIFGTPTADALDIFGRGFPCFDGWLGHLGSIFAEGVKHQHVAAPLDVVLWSSGSKPLGNRYYSLESLQCYKQ